MGLRAPIKPLPSTERLYELFDYDPIDGLLMWKVGSVRGKEAGTLTKRGYVQVGIGGVYYLVHRIVWKIMTCHDPDGQIDHIDGDRTNNRWNNLRLADNGKNIRNSKRRKDNKTGIKGVCWEAKRQKWRVQISCDGKNIKIGRFETLEDAAHAANKARIQLHGEFSRFE